MFIYIAGHISLLEKALTFGDYVIVGVYSDVLAGALYERERNGDSIEGRDYNGKDAFLMTYDEHIYVNT
jgi:phosphopantetheine adenylyltransferase